ncbi:PREDICTED: protein bric-a-brac 2-like [Papilio xuthus]|uniref:Protein bric-a-brac 2-like n=1 Tax=Papilio xuthus TaxID=66420 RepID=A0AAJ7ELA4_PAPXU|nr:PREDICTED: protein bric-a-brac 2-like [Papilio xuthus]
MTKKYSLRWIDFHTNLYHSLESFLKAEELVDVTLSAGGKDFHAHKLILSICSPFFKDLFIKNPCEHPIVVLKEVEHVELCKLLQYIYHGEVHVTQQELNPFLETAEFLQIKGLASVREKNETAPDESNDQEATKEPNLPLDCQSESDSKTKDTTKTTDPPKDSVSESIKKDSKSNSKKRSIHSTSNNNNCNDVKKARRDSDGVSNEGSKESKDIAHTVETACSNKPETLVGGVCSKKSETTVGSVCRKKPETSVGGVCSKKPETTVGGVCSKEPETTQNSGSSSKTDTVTKFNCVHCHRLFANSYNLKVHIQDKHDKAEKTLKCRKCHKRMKNPSCLRVHMYTHHKPVYQHHSFNYKPE